MQTIGEKLEEARKRKGISIREAAESTKIRGDYLQKFEANTFEIDLPPLYLKGFVRSYARFLELDAERIVSELTAHLSAGKPGRRERETREVYGRVDFGETPRPAESIEPGSPATSNAQRGNSNDQAAMIKLGLIGAGVVIGIVVIFLLVKVLFGGPDNPTRPETATSSVQAEASQTLTLTAIDATRVKVVQELDGAVLFNGNLARGETSSVKKQGKLLITVEIGKNLRMEVNGRNYAVPLDGYGRFALD